VNARGSRVWLTDVTLPSLATLARRALDDAAIPYGAGVVVACSGGMDSQVLLDVLAHVASPARGPRAHAPPGLRLIAVGVDHGLRAEAGGELSLAAELADARGVPFRKVELAVAKGSNLQARARDARYEALRAVAVREAASFLATGHHLDDRAETVLIRILRGAPVEGLAVLAPASNDLLRPLIRASRAQIESHARKRSIRYAVDPSNTDRRHLRVRVREEVLPLLRSLDPQIVEHLAALADGAERARVVLGTSDGSPVPVISARTTWRSR
jgi:tRNA(Ile)-lysidine synthase